MMEFLWSAAMKAAESGRVPNSVVRAGIRRLCAERLREERLIGRNVAEFVERASQGPVAPVPEKANEQHYEVPPEFFQAALGPRLKYSSCYWPEGVSTLAEAEEAALSETCRRAGLADGQDILELGCGWGSLSLWMAEHYPHSAITVVSNSVPQRRFIESRAREFGLSNLKVLTCDMNVFQVQQEFDRVVSVEMFEHMRNHRELLSRIAGWLRPQGQLFVHIFCHRDFVYPFETEDATEWLGRHFFTGGVMPSYDLLTHFPDQMSQTHDWRWSGQHYERTANAWIANMDAHKDLIVRGFRQVYGEDQANIWFHRWRIFFMACAELWGYSKGEEWLVGHYLLERPQARGLAAA